MLTRPRLPYPPVAPFTPEFAASFWSKIEIGEPGSCWRWAHSVGGSGYGHQWHAGHCYDSHKLAILLSRGPIPNGKLVLHSCNNKLCCNPRHLCIGSAADNARAALRDGLVVKTLSPADVAAIARERHAGRLRIELAGRYGVKVQHITRILTGESWGHLTGIVASAPAPGGEQLAFSLEACA